MLLNILELFLIHLTIKFTLFLVFLVIVGFLILLYIIYIYEAKGKTDTLLGGPITELTTLAYKLCDNKNPAIVLETDSW